MNRLMLPALAVAAVSLLSGCQVVTVRHYYPEPVQVIETRGPVYTVPAHRHEPPPKVVIVRPAPPVRVVAPLPPRHPAPPYTERRRERAPEHPPVPHERNREHRPSPPAPQKVRVIPVTPQVKGGLFGATQQAVRQVQTGKTDKPKPAAPKEKSPPKKEEKPQQNKPQKGREEHRHGS